MRRRFSNLLLGRLNAAKAAATDARSAGSDGVMVWLRRRKRSSPHRIQRAASYQRQEHLSRAELYFYT